MPDPRSDQRLKALPPTIRTMLENAPLLQHEDRSYFIELFLELENSPGGGIRPMAEYLMIVQATKLVMNLQRYERQRVRLMLHVLPAAVLNMHLRMSPLGTAQPGSLDYSSAVAGSRAYFTSEQDKQKSLAQFRRAGYSEESVEAEGYVQGHPLLIPVERQIAAAERNLMLHLKELDRRYGRREEARRAASRALARGRDEALREQRDGN